MGEIVKEELHIYIIPTSYNCAVLISGRFGLAGRIIMTA